jgi:putative hemolysin
MKTIIISTLSLAILLCLVGCTASPSTVEPAQQAGLPNPASVYCEEQGGQLEIITAEDGSQSGLCLFPDGSRCDEWAFFRNECRPGDSLAQFTPEGAQEAAPAPSATSEEASDGWTTYRNEEFGYSFQYPSDAEIVQDDNPLGSISIIGPLVDDEFWPQFTISHPRDREEYRPPEDADLLRWLTDHNLLGDEQKPDIQIAGTTAIHLRHERSSQSYAFDRYYFTRGGQLYMIVIGHAGDREDWELYNHFLSSFQFGN